MNKVKKIIIVFGFLFIFLVSKVSASDMYSELWKIEDAFKGVGKLFYIDNYTKLHQFQDNYLLEFRYEKDDVYYVMVLFDSNGNKINLQYLMSNSNENRHQLYYYKDRIYLIDDYYTTVINIYNDKLEKVSTEEEFGGDDLSVPIYDVTFFEDNMYIFYRTNTTGSNSIKYTFYVYQYDLDGKFIESFSYDYSSLNMIKLGEEQLSNEIYSKQLYFYDKDENKSLTFNYEKNDFELVDYVVPENDSYYSILNVFCEAAYLCDYGKIDNYYFVDNHKFTDDDSYTYGNVSIKDEELTELFKFKNYASYKDNLMVKNDNYFIYTTSGEENDSKSKIYSVTLGQLEDMDIENAIVSKIFGDDLFVVSNEDNDIKIAKYDLAYDIVINDSSNGSVSVDNLLKMAGEEVMISISSLEGYALDNLSVVTQDGEEVKVTNNKFIMPESDIYISAVFVEGEENPNTSDFVVSLIFILFICSWIIIFVTKHKSSQY